MPQTGPTGACGWLGCWKTELALGSPEETAAAQANSHAWLQQQQATGQAKPALPAASTLAPDVDQALGHAQPVTIQMMLQYLFDGKARLKAMACSNLANVPPAALVAGLDATSLERLLQALIAMLRTDTGTDQGRMYAAIILAGLSSTLDSQQHAPSLCAATVPLLSAAQAAILAAARKEALRALGKLLRHLGESASKELMAHGGHKALVDMLESEDGSTRCQTLQALYYYAADKLQHQEALSEAGLIPHLLRLCHCQDVRVVYQSVQVLKMLCKSKVCCNTVRACGGAATLSSLIRFSTHTDTRKAAQVAQERMELISRTGRDITNSAGKSRSSQRLLSLSQQANSPFSSPQVQRSGVLLVGQGCASRSPPHEGDAECKVVGQRSGSQLSKGSQRGGRQVDQGAGKLPSPTGSDTSTSAGSRQSLQPSAVKQQIQQRSAGRLQARPEPDSPAESHCSNSFASPAATLLLPGLAPIRTLRTPQTKPSPTMLPQSGSRPAPAAGSCSGTAASKGLPASLYAAGPSPEVSTAGKQPAPSSAARQAREVAKLRQSTPPRTQKEAVDDEDGSCPSSPDNFFGGPSLLPMPPPKSVLTGSSMAHGKLFTSHPISSMSAGESHSGASLASTARALGVKAAHAASPLMSSPSICSTATHDHADCASSRYRGQPTDGGRSSGQMRSSSLAGRESLRASKGMAGPPSALKSSSSKPLPTLQQANGPSSFRESHASTGMAPAGVTAMEERGMRASSVQLPLAAALASAVPAHMGLSAEAGALASPAVVGTPSGAPAVPVNSLPPLALAGLGAVDLNCSMALGSPTTATPMTAREAAACVSHHTTHAAPTAHNSEAPVEAGQQHGGLPQGSSLQEHLRASAPQVPSVLRPMQGLLPAQQVPESTLVDAEQGGSPASSIGPASSQVVRRLLVETVEPSKAGGSLHEEHGLSFKGVSHPGQAAEEAVDLEEAAQGSQAAKALAGPVLAGNRHSQGSGAIAVQGPTPSPSGQLRPAAQARKAISPFSPARGRSLEPALSAASSASFPSPCIAAESAFVVQGLRGSHAADSPASSNSGLPNPARGPSAAGNKPSPLGPSPLSAAPAAAASGRRGSGSAGGTGSCGPLLGLEGGEASSSRSTTPQPGNVPAYMKMTVAAAAKTKMPSRGGGEDALLRALGHASQGGSGRWPSQGGSGMFSIHAAAAAAAAAPASYARQHANATGQGSLAASQGQNSSQARALQQGSAWLLRKPSVPPFLAKSTPGAGKPGKVVEAGGNVLARGGSGGASLPGSAVITKQPVHKRLLRQASSGGAKISSAAASLAAAAAAMVGSGGNKRSVAAAVGAPSRSKPSPLVLAKGQAAGAPAVSKGRTSGTEPLAARRATLEEPLPPGPAISPTACDPTRPAKSDSPRIAGEDKRSGDASASHKGGQRKQQVAHNHNAAGPQPPHQPGSALSKARQQLQLQQERAWAQQHADAHQAELCGSPLGSRDSVDDILQLTSGKLGAFLLRPEDITICRGPDGRKVVLGEGGFSMVYKGAMNGVDEVAVKVAKKGESMSRRELEMFVAEASLMARLHHRNIVQAYGVCLAPGRLSLVTELMRGGDMYRALRNHPALMKWEVLGRKVALDIALGLNHLHCQQPPLMHRDLKSPNVLLSEEGVAKIADVGMSRAQVSDLVSAQPIMTPLWAAPEVVNKQKASIKCDIWSYGVLIWELVTGLDITDYQPLAMSRQLGLTGPKTLWLPEDAPEVVVRIFESCTETEPSHRPTAGQIVEWLRAAEGV